MPPAVSSQAPVAPKPFKASSRFVVRGDCETAAFHAAGDVDEAGHHAHDHHDARRKEVARILRAVADEIEGKAGAGPVLNIRSEDCGDVFDALGHKVGNYVLIHDPPPAS